MSLKDKVISKDRKRIVLVEGFNGNGKYITAWVDNIPVCRVWYEGDAKFMRLVNEAIRQAEDMAEEKRKELEEV